MSDDYLLIRERPQLRQGVMCCFNLNDRTTFDSMRSQLAVTHAASRYFSKYSVAFILLACNDHLPKDPLLDMQEVYQFATEYVDIVL
jgi:hypothetical protein